MNYLNPNQPHYFSSRYRAIQKLYYFSVMDILCSNVIILLV